MSAKSIEPDYKDLFEYHEDFIKDSENIMKDLLNEIELSQNTVKVFGRKYNEPRLTAIYGDENILDKKYKYSNSERTLKPMTKTLINLQKILEKRTEIHFDFVLINYYRDESDKIGLHSDNEPMMNCDFIASLSFGSERIFKFKDKKSKELVWKQELKSGSLVLMKKDCQEILLHEIPKTLKPKEPRLNLTFRRFK
jgi:alkylated DNA repair dioxygenase AlkB